MEQKKGNWYASGKERRPGNLLRYTLLVLIGVVFAVVALVLMFVGGGTAVGMALLWGAIAAAITAVLGLIVWFVYIKLIVKQ